MNEFSLVARGLVRDEDLLKRQIYKMSSGDFELKIIRGRSNEKVYVIEFRSDKDFMNLLTLRELVVGGEKIIFEKFKDDWDCSRCNKTNFSFRVKCFKCGTTRESDGNLIDSLVQFVENKSVLLTGLNALTNVEDLEGVLEKFTDLILNIKVPTKPPSTGLAVVETIDCESAFHIKSFIESKTPFRIDGSEINCYYVKSDADWRIFEFKALKRDFKAEVSDFYSDLKEQRDESPFRFEIEAEPLMRKISKPVDYGKKVCNLCELSFSSFKEFHAHLKFDKDHSAFMHEFLRANPELKEKKKLRKEKEEKSKQELLTENVGAKMLQKLGWSLGEGLGKDKSGISEPIEAERVRGKRGLGRR